MIYIYIYVIYNIMLYSILAPDAARLVCICVYVYIYIYIYIYR